MSSSATTSNRQSTLQARLIGRIRDGFLALGVILALASFTPAYAGAAEAAVVTGPASIMDVLAELRRHHTREYRLDVSGSGSIDRERYLRDHRDREYGTGSWSVEDR